MYAVWSFFTKRNSFSFLLLVALIVTGLLAVVQIKKESAPSVQIPIAIISTPLPSASAQDVEQLVTDPIEEHLNNNLDEVSTITSTSREGVSVVTVESSASANIDESIRAVKDEIDSVVPDLPNEAETPTVSEVDFVDQPIMTVSMTSNRPFTDFVDLAEQVENELENVSGVSRVEKSGVREREVSVVLDKERLHQFRLNITDVISSIASANGAIPVGVLNVNDVEYSLQFEGDIESPSVIEDIPIARRGGVVMYVKDVALVSNGLSPANSYSRLSAGGAAPQQAVTFSIFKSREDDVTQVASDVRDKLQELQSSLLADSTVEIVLDSGDLVREDLVRLSLTGLQTVLLVMLVLLVALGWREALIAGFAIPLSFLIAFIGLWQSGNTLNFVSLFSLILAVGILVDSAIVITESIHTKIQEGMDKTTAALDSIREFHAPLTSGTMTTVAVFFPLFFISGVTGEFIASIPFTIIIVLLASLFVALAIIPLVAATFLKKRKKSKGAFIQTVEQYTDRFRVWYRTKLRMFFNDRPLQNTVFMALGLLFIISIMLPAIGAVSVIFFPEEDSDFLFVEMEMPSGTTLGATDEAVNQLEDVLVEKAYIDSFSTTVGALSAFQDGTPGSQYANITVLLSEDRTEESGSIRQRLLRELREQKNPDSEVRIFEQTAGPPTGAPISITFSGEDMDDVTDVARAAQDALDEIPGTVNVQTDLQQEGVDFVLQPDRERIVRAGLSVTQVAQMLRASVSGVNATTIRTDGEDIDVVVKTALNPEFSSVDTTNAATLEAIKSLEIFTPEGVVLLGSLLESSVQQRNAVIHHEDLDRVANVSSELESGMVASEVLQRFQNRFSESELPEGVSMSVGGETEDVDQSFQDMFFALIYGLLLIVAILVIQFNSFREVLFIVGIIPFMLIGILVGLAIVGLPLSFPSIMGFIALAGIVVNNSIILVDTINRLRAENNSLSFKESVVLGAESRLRPIVLTTATTVIGIIPLTYASALWSPLAFAIIFGLSFSIMLTLFIVPLIYYRWSSV